MSISLSLGLGSLGATVRSLIRTLRTAGRANIGTDTGIPVGCWSGACPNHGVIYDSVVVRITCVCGVVLEGRDNDDLWGLAQAHIRTDHPDLVGQVSREDILAQTEEI